jgi:hypothetical protein
MSSCSMFAKYLPQFIMLALLTVIPSDDLHDQLAVIRQILLLDSATPSNTANANQPKKPMATKTPTGEPSIDEAAVVKSKPKWTKEQELRRAKIASCLATYYRQPVDADKLRPWSIMHGLIGYGQRSWTIVGGKPVNTVEYLAANGAGDGMQILYLEDGKIQTRLGPGVQGHEGQLLAMFAQADVPAAQPMTIEGKSFTVQDLIDFEMSGCTSGKELTFKLISLAHYLDPDARWKNHLGEDWDMSRLIREELAQPLTEGACGGTHRLTALSYAVNARVKRNQPLEGEWLRADTYVMACQGHTFNNLQNSDGSFSTLFFKGRENHTDLMRRLYATGHILEWLAYSLPEKNLHDFRVTVAVDYLLDLMLTAPGHALDVGPRGHAIHALVIYEQRAFGTSSDWADTSNIVKLPMTSKMVLPSATKSSIPADSGLNSSPYKRSGFMRRR